jgi:hypothetical protein
VREQLPEDELAHLSLAIMEINGRNRLNIAARTPWQPRGREPAKLHAGS